MIELSKQRNVKKYFFKPAYLERWISLILAMVGVFPKIILFWLFKGEMVHNSGHTFI